MSETIIDAEPVEEVHGLLAMVKEWEAGFKDLYDHKPRMVEREQFFLGLLFATQAGWAYRRLPASENKHA